MKTKAAILAALKKPLVVDEIEAPVPGEGQVLVKMLAAGVCRSQLNEQQGLKGEDPYLPHLLGHEGAAEVIQAGSGVSRVEEGDYTVVSWIKAEGRDAPGGKYRWGSRVVNSGGAAVFTQYAVVSENRLTKINRKVPPEAAAVIGCAVATGAGAVRHLTSAGDKTKLAVYGAGGVGLCAVMAAVAAGCGEIIAVDVSGKKLELARSLGAHSAVKPDSELLKDLDYAIEATGLPDVMEKAFKSLSPQGRLIIAGHPPEGSLIKIDPFALICGKRITGTWGGQSVPDEDFPYYAQQFLAGKMPLKKLITHSYPLEGINEAFKRLAQGDAGRIVIRF